MTNIEQIEASLVQIEGALNVRITIIDREGFFHDQDGQAIFPRERHSHQANELCKLHFQQACVDHCRHYCNKFGQKRMQSFETKCWKQIREIAVPLFLNARHLGTLFIGQWRNKQTQLDAPFSRRFKQAFAKMDIRNPSRVQELKQLGQFLADSIILQIQTLKQQHSEPGLPHRKHEIESFIQQETGPQLNLQALAQYLHLSESRCSHLVKELFDTSLHQLILAERIRRAQQLLRSSDYSTAEIASLIGFSDHFYFNKVFKQECGLPPGRFRKQFS